MYVNLVYGDPDAGFGDYLWLSRQGCAVMFDVTAGRRPLTVGPFEGSVVESSSGTVGALFDGATGIRFETDLAVATSRPPRVAPAVRPRRQPEPLTAASTG